MNQAHRVAIEPRLEREKLGKSTGTMFRAHYETTIVIQPTGPGCCISANPHEEFIQMTQSIFAQSGIPAVIREFYQIWIKQLRQLLYYISHRGFD